MFFSATRIIAWGYWPAFGFTFLPLAFLLFWGIFRPLSLTRGEWKEGTAPFLRSLPVSGWSIIGAKLLAAFTEWVGLNLATLALSGLFYAAAPLCGAEWVPLTDLPPLAEAIKILAAFGTNYALGIFLGATIFQLAYLLAASSIALLAWSASLLRFFWFISLLKLASCWPGYYLFFPVYPWKSLSFPRM